jgi:GDYXXLXY protein
MRRRTAIVGVLVVQAVVFAGLVVREEVRLRESHTVRLATAPVDPHDVLRGQYMTLSYADAEVSVGGDGDVYPLEGEEVLVVLEARGGPAGLWEPTRIATDDDRDLVRIRAIVLEEGDPFLVRFPDIERAYLSSSTPPVPPSAEPPAVVVAVTGDGTARVIRLEVVGSPGRLWP